MEKINKPMKNGELFNKIVEILKEKNLLPDILDYGLPETDLFELRTYEFEFIEKLDYGYSEGIYLDIGIKIEVDGKWKTVQLGTFKTLKEDREAFLTMANLLGNFIFEAGDYVRAHIDDFAWFGFNITPYDDEGNEVPWKYLCETPESAVKEVSHLFEKFNKVHVRNNENRAEEQIKKANWDNTLHCW